MNTGGALGVVGEFDLMMGEHESGAAGEHGGHVAGQALHGAGFEVVEQFGDDHGFVAGARQAGGQGGLFYSDFVQLCVDVCVRTAGGRVGGAARRLEQPAPRADADGDEESEEQPGLDEQLRALLSRMGTDANAAVPVAA